MTVENEQPVISRRSFLKAATGLAATLMFRNSPALAAKDQTPVTQPPMIIPTIPEQQVPQSVFEQTNKQLDSFRTKEITGTKLDFYRDVAKSTADQFNTLFASSYTNAMLVASMRFVTPDQIKSVRPALKSVLAITDADKQVVYINQKRLEDEIDQISQGNLPFLSKQFEQIVGGNLRANKQAITVEYLRQVLVHEWGHMVMQKAQSVDFATPMPTYAFGGTSKPDYYIAGLNQFRIQLKATDNPKGPIISEQNGLNEAFAEWFALALARHSGRTYIDRTTVSFGANILDTLVKKSRIAPAEIVAYISGKKPFNELLSRFDVSMGTKQGEAIRLMQAYTDFSEQANALNDEGKATLLDSYRKVILTNTSLVV